MTKIFIFVKINIMKFSDSVYSESTLYAFGKSFLVPTLRPAFCRCLPSILFNFFLRQFYIAFFPGKIPLSKVDHALDEKIPFVPSWVAIYIDFTQFWIRMISFFIRRYGRKAYLFVREFIMSMGELYAFAAQVYTRNVSTTKRPFYIAGPRFFMIHLLDPHLFCVPSLHVMVVIHAYLQFVQIAKKLGEEEKLKDQIEELKQGALAISQAILYVKQHSVNCLPAALYAVTCFSPSLFPSEEAQAFANLLFSPAPSKEKAPQGSRVHPAASPASKISEGDQAQIKKHILSLYKKFLSEKDSARSWYEPLLSFLQNMPRA